MKFRPFKLLGLLALLVVVAAGGYVVGTLRTHDHRATAAAPAGGKTLYTCGMHPNVIQDEPGNCPICHMKLTPIRGGGGGAPAGGGAIAYYKSTMIPGETSPVPAKDSMGMEMVPVYEGEAAMDAAISIDPVTVQNMGLRTALVTNGPLQRTIRTVATIDYDETALAEVSTKFKGWIEKLYVDATGALVHRGDPLLEVYSPELYSAQTEYLLATRSGGAGNAGAEALRESARTKLKYWDISDAQIAELEQSGKPAKTLKISAPMDGFVVEKQALQGQMVEAGKQLYRLADLDLVWVHAQVYEQDLPFVRLGQEALVTLSYLPDRKFRGRVTYIYPTVDAATRTARVRMEFHNPGYFLKPGMFATVELTSALARSALLVPDMAVLRSGERNTVFVSREGGKFSAREVQLGVRAGDGLVQVLSGLRAGERVVTSGQFMLDSESQLREAIQKMMEPPGARLTSGGGAPSPAASDHSAHDDHPAGEPPKATYICPMPEHVAIEYDQPGDCSLCGMALVPVSQELLAKIQPGGTVDYYTCPMPEHADVKLDRGGKCPKCRMTLIPVMPPPPEPEPPAPLPTLYTCPMASHAHVVSDEPGKCPECEMKLVPTGEVAHAELAEQHWREQHPTGGAAGNSRPELPTLYTCPMASHAHIVSDEPGKCPECEMKLVPTGEVEHGKRSEEHWLKEHPPAATEEGEADPGPVYTCPMHPEVKQSQPGVCPICNMKLAPNA